MEILIATEYKDMGSRRWPWYIGRENAALGGRGNACLLPYITCTLLPLDTHRMALLLHGNRNVTKTAVQNGAMAKLQIERPIDHAKGDCVLL